MRKLFAHMIVAGSALGVLAISTATSPGNAGALKLPLQFDAQSELHPGVVLVQSRRQQRDMDAFLDDNEFKDPEVVQKEAPRFFVEACRREKKYLLMFNREGEYFGSRKLGECKARPKAVSLQELRYWLEDRNYTDIRFTDATPPKRVAEGCLDGRQYTITFDAAGKGTPARKWFSNSCRKKTTENDRDDRDDRDDRNDRDDTTTPTFGLSKDAARLALRRAGYTDTRFDRRFNESSLVEACQGVRKFRLFLDRRAAVSARRAVGFCEQNVKNADIRPRRPNIEALEDSRGPLKAAQCQAVLNWMQYQTPIVFESASDEISSDSRSVLETIADNVERCPTVMLSIEGHTDSIGPARFNRKLSEDRAESVRRYLVRRGVSRRRLTVKGFGEKYPLTNNLIERDRTRNRRIDLVLEWGNASDLGLSR